VLDPVIGSRLPGSAAGDGLPPLVGVNVVRPDLARAAWELDTWDAGDIARQARTMPTAQLESLVEGAWHGGESNVDAAVRAVNPRRRSSGPFGSWCGATAGTRPAAQQLDKLEHKDAMAFSKALLAAGGSTRTSCGC
jgi:hypothetical protein